jgi:bifunctional non-homologous end joining protein LigD
LAGVLPRIAPPAPTLVDQLQAHPDLITEVKYDGFRCVAYCQDREVTLVSRHGHAFSSRSYEPVREALSKLGAHAILDGELVCLDPEGMPIFNAMMWRRGTVYYQVFDCRTSAAT